MPKTLPDNKTHHLYHDSHQHQEKPQKTKTALGDLRQDKRRFFPPRAPSAQPAAVTDPQRAQPLNTNGARGHTVTDHKRKKEKLTLWVDPIDIEKLRLKARRAEASLSSVGAEALKKSLHEEADIDYSITLKPLIEATIDRRMAARDNRLALLLVRNYLVGEQNRGLTTYLVGRVPDMTPEVLNDLLDTTFREAKKKLIRRSPELEELIKEVKSWVIAGEEQKGKERKL
jgi:hypothetical protein